MMAADIIAADIIMADAATSADVPNLMVALRSSDIKE
jgi:hypothetical protein